MIWGLAGILMFAAGIVLTLLARKEQSAATKIEQEEDSFDPLAARRTGWAPAPLIKYLNQLGLNLTPSSVNLLMVGEIAAIVVLWLLFAPRIALFSIMALLLFSHFALKSAGAKQKQKLLASLPSFLNQVSRRLSAGVSVEHAFTDSMENIEGPLELSMRRVMQRVGLGLELNQAFEREARANGVKELLIVSTALHINEQFGGSIRSILEDIVQILRLDELGKRELQAQTGETRVTAVILVMLPVAVLVLLLSQNPDFLTGMWDDPFGKNMLTLAGILQVLGTITIWRMLRSI